ncbi:SOSS complex subunit C-like [Saccoglossus kowalevskii]|uniref:SOSS complex subunit C-like n=1 Tax=Saccoglossus kowalevskii TaxID=10224 RepID=A0ABM0GKQ0_SACKO|nr:PREDICTED: SOSS complex subunit C-like [Saccoglossus kowalevskii]
MTTAAGTSPAINVGQEKQNRKILEDLQQEKKRLRMMQGQGQTNSMSSTSSVVPGNQTIQRPVPVKEPVLPVLRDPTEAHHLAMSQRTALQHAHANSAAFFITQDSSFGNLILPVIPRIPPDS